MRVRVRARFVLAHRDGEHRMLADGEVVWQGDKIIFVGHRFGQAVDEDVDLGGSLVMPGLIDLDALADIDHLLIDSWQGADLAKGLRWSAGYARAPHDVFTAAERREVREYALVQLALHGVTTFMPIASEIHSGWAESFEDLVELSQVSRRIGLRGYLGPSYRSGVRVVHRDGRQGVHRETARGREGLADAVRFLDYCLAQGDPLVTGVLLPCRIETLDPDLMRETARVSAERGVRVRLHALQGAAERDLVTRQFEMTPLDLLDSTGLLNERFLLPHAIFTDQSSLLPVESGREPGDLGRLAAAGVTVVHCPLTSFRYGMILESFGRYQAAGINVALGTDSFPPDLIRGMDTGVHAAAWVDRRRDAATAARYVNAATLGGAAGLGRPDLGRLQPGAQADLIAFRMDDLRDGVIDDPIRTLLLSGTARQVTHAVVAGRFVVWDGQVPGVDVHRLRRRGQELFAKMRSAYPTRDAWHRPESELFPPSFPPLEPGPCTNP